MGVRTSRVGRRGFLGRALLLGGTGALGSVVAGTVGTGGTADAAEAQSPRNFARLTLLGADWHVLGDAGSLPQAGATPLTAGTLTSPSGTVLGEFRSSRLNGATLLHQFELTDGTLFGLGQGTLSDADFAMVGGTGRYAGTTGAYAVRQHPSELGGAGTATFELSITLPSTPSSVLGALISSSAGS